MRYLILALCLLQATAYPAAAVFSSSTEVKTLKDNLSINAKCKLLTGTADPTSVAQNAPACSVYMNTSTGRLYRKTDAGSSTNWNRVVSPSGAGTSGQVPTADGSGSEAWATTASAPDSSLELSNFTLTASVAASALTIAVKTKAGTDATGADIVGVGMRNVTITTGTYLRRTITAALSLVISSGSTLGHVSATAEPIYVYLMDNAGTLELAASTRLFGEGSVQSSTAEGGAGASDSRTVLYSTTARSNVPVRLVGRLSSTQATAGTYATAIAEIALPPFSHPLIIERTGPVLVKKQGSTNTAYLQKNDATQNYPIVVGPDSGATANGLMVIRGVITSAGAATTGEGFTPSKTGTGTYTVTFTTAFADIPACYGALNGNIVGTNTSSSNGYVFAALSASAFNFATYNTSAVASDLAWMFICVGQRP